MKSKLITIVIIVFVFTDIVTEATELYKRAPDTLPGTLTEMRYPSYWIEKMDKPDDVILTIDEIQHMNEDYKKKYVYPILLKIILRNGNSLLGIIGQAMLFTFQIFKV